MNYSNRDNPQYTLIHLWGEIVPLTTDMRSDMMCLMIRMVHASIQLLELKNSRHKI